jgi:uncharacterized protein DUF1236
MEVDFGRNGAFEVGARGSAEFSFSVDGASVQAFSAARTEKAMKGHRIRPPIGRSPTLLVLACAAVAFIGGGVERAAAQSNNIDEAVGAHGVSPKLELTLAQRSAIYQEVHKSNSKVAPSRFATDVPPMTELYTLPDDILANNPDTKLYKFTRVDDQVVLVDPVKMRVIAVIGAKTKD